MTTQQKSARVRRRVRRHLIALYGAICMKCRHSQFALTIDHVLPRAQGGRFLLHNLQLLCLDCNEQKANQHIDYRPFHPGSRPVPKEKP